MNYIDRQTLIREVSRKLRNREELEYRYIRNLQQWLEYPAGVASWDFDDVETEASGGRIRYSGSIVSRADAELFGLSYPRFSIRAYLDRNHSSFLHFRRREHLSDRVVAALNEDLDEEILEELESMQHDLPKEVQARLRTYPPKVLEAYDAARAMATLGDCVLRVPPRLAGTHTIIRPKTWLLYGSEYENLRDIHSTSYVHYASFLDCPGCGMAVCFMAMTALAESVTCLCGLTELPAVLSDIKEEPTARIDDITPRDVCALLESKHVGLSGCLQMVYDHDSPWGATSEETIYGKALEAYICSGMPVIALCDRYRLHGFGPGFADSEVGDRGDPTAIYPSASPSDPSLPYLGYALERTTQELSRGNHMILLVGAEPRKGRFVFHDPSGFPYVPADLGNLVKAAHYKKGAAPDEDGPTEVNEFQFISVAPKGVRLPLLTAIDYEAGRLAEGAWFLGLELVTTAIVKWSRSLGGTTIPRILTEKMDRESTDHRRDVWNEAAKQGQFRLVHLSDLDRSQVRRTFRKILPDDRFPRFFRDLQTLAPKGRKKDAWAWVFLLPEFFVAIDAGKKVDAGLLKANGSRDMEKLARQFVLGAFRLGNDLPHSGEGTGDGGRAKLLVPPDGFRRPPGWPLLGNVRKSLVSSFCAKGMRSSADPLQVYFDHPGLAMEMYAFLQNDLTFLMNDAKDGKGEELANCGSPKRSAVHNLDALWNQGAGRDAWIESMAKRTDAALTREKDGRIRRIQISGLATFIPELTSHRKIRRDRGLNALSFIACLAGELQRLESGSDMDGHPVSTIELVAGTRAGRLDWRPASAGYRAVSFGKRDLTQILSNLCDMLKEVAARSHYEGIYSIELEPGALFALHDKEGLEEAASIVRRKLIDKGVKCGFNLDIAHWALSGVKPAQLPANVKELVAHVHICDWWRGHVDDGRLLTAQSTETYGEWLAFIEERIGMDGRAPFKFSGYTSLELECAKNRKQVTDSIAFLDQMLAFPPADRARP